jgi:rhodanese-related sulfurtransferase
MHPHTGESIVKTVTLLLISALATVAMPLAYSADDAGTQAGNGRAGRPPAPKAHVLTREELDKLLAQPDKVLVIDVRRPDEVSTNGGLPVYLSVQIGDLEKEIAWIPKDRQIITLSNHAARAGHAADILAAKGFNVVGAAGAETYEQQGGTLTKIPVPPPRPSSAGGAAPAP